MKSWITQYDINQLMDNVQDCKRQIIPIIFRDVSGIQELDSHRLLKHIMQIVKCLRWPEGSKSDDSKLAKKRVRFFKELRLRLPPIRSRVSPSRESVYSNASFAGLTDRVEDISETTPPASRVTTPPVPEENRIPTMYPNLESNPHAVNS